MEKSIMKTLIIAASLLALTSTAMASSVGVSINVGEPNFYGRINIGDFPQPRVVYSQPVIVERPVHYVEQQPVYLRVPPGHAKHWSKHCREYNACNQRVYFVQDDWYNNEYVPRYREQHIEYRDRDHHERDHHDHDRNDRHDNGRDNRNDDHGHDHDHGHDRD
jgi:hypothetical protein